MAGSRRSRRLIGALVVLVLTTTGCAWIKRSSVPVGTAVGTPTLGGISRSGRYVAFTGDASTYLTTLGPGATQQGFVRDNVGATTQPVTVSSTGALADAAAAAVDLSDDGRYVVISSAASNLVTGDADGKVDAFVRDRTAGTTTLVSVNDDESPMTADVYATAISGDGRTVALCIRSTIGVPVCADTAIRHLDTGTTIVLPHLHGATFATTARLSTDGSRVAFGDAFLNGGPATVWSGVADTTTGAVLADLGSATLEFSDAGAVDVDISGDGTTWALTESHGRFTATPTGVVTVGHVDGSAPTVVHTYRWIRSARLSSDGSVLAVLGFLSPTPEVVAIDRGADPPIVVSADTVAQHVAPVYFQFDLSTDGRWVTFVTNANETLGGAAGDTAYAVYTRSVAQTLTPPS